MNKSPNNSVRDRTQSLIKEIVRRGSAYFARESNRTSLITITRAEISPDGKRATVFVSVLPKDKEEAAISFIKRKTRDFEQSLRDELRGRPIPRITLERDIGEENRILIDQLLKEH